MLILKSVKAQKEQVEMAVIPQTQFTTIPTGEYQVEITDAQLVEGQFGEQVEFLLTLTEGEHEGANLRAWTSAKFSPKSRLYGYARAAFGGKEIPADYNLDTDALIGRKVLAVVTTKEKLDGSVFNKVEDLRPVRKAPSTNGMAF